MTKPAGGAAGRRSSPSLYAEERQLAIMRLARESGRVAVSELAGRFEVTPETIRRDLEVLASTGLLSRVHGGAVPAEKLMLTEVAVDTRETAHPTEKAAIATAALAQLPAREGLSVLVDAGTTVFLLAELLPVGQVVTVVTNSLPTAGAMARRGLKVIMLGGEIRGITQAAVGAQALESLGRLSVDVAFLGANGFTADRGFSTPDPAEAAVKRAMAASARQVVVLADASKLGADFLVTFAACEDVDVLVTDATLPAHAVEQFRAAGVEVVLA